MSSCTLRPKCSNGKESKLYQELHKFTGKDRKLTNKYYKLAIHPQFVEGVDDSLISRDSNNELTLHSFLQIANLEDVDVKLLEYLNSQYTDSLPLADAINKVKEFNRDRSNKGLFIATMAFDGSLDKVKVSIIKDTPSGKAESQKTIENMIAIRDIVNQLKSVGIKDDYIQSIVTGNFTSLENVIQGFRTLVSLSKGGPIKSFSETDFQAAANFAYEVFKDTPIMRRFTASISADNYQGDTNPVNILAKTLQNYKWGKMNVFMSRVREFIYNIFQSLGFNTDRYSVEAEQIIRGLYSATSLLPKYKSYDKYMVGYSTAQKSLGAILSSVKTAASDIHNASTLLYESFFAQFNRKHLLSELQLNTLDDEICYTSICEITASMCEVFTNTLDAALKLSSTPENLTLKADYLRSCRDMYISIVTISKELETAVKGLSASTDPETTQLRYKLSASMSAIKDIVRKDSSLVAALQQEERNVTLAFFEEVLGKDCITVSAHRYLSMKGSLIPKLKYRHSVSLTAEDIVDKYVSYESVSRWIKSLSNSKDIAIAELEQYMRSIKFKEEKVKDNYFVRLMALVDRMKSLGVNHKDMSWGLETDANGKITGNFIVEEWWGEYARQRREVLNRIRDEFDNKVKSGEITVANSDEMRSLWKDYYESHPEYILFMDEAFMDKDAPISKRRVLNLNKYTNPAYWNLSENQRGVLKDFISLKSEVDNYCLKDSDGTMHGRRLWVPQFKKGSKSVNSDSFILGNDVTDFAESAEFEDYGSPELASMSSEDMDIFDFERDTATNIILYGIQKSPSTLANLETNLAHSMAKYILMAIRYKTVKETASYLYVAKTVLGRRENVSNDLERIDESSMFATAEQSDSAMSDLIKKYSGNPSSSKSYKAISKLISTSSILLLGFNLISAVRNKLAGNAQTKRGALSGKTPFTIADLYKSKWYQTLDYLFLIPNTLWGSSKHFSRTLALLDYAGSLRTSDSRLQSFNKSEIGTKVSSALLNLAMSFMSVGDNSITANLFRSCLISHKGFDLKTGKRRSIWDEMKFQDGRYLYQGMLVKNHKDLQLASTLQSLKEVLTRIADENALIENDEDKLDYFSNPQVNRYLDLLRNIGYPIEILVEGTLLSEDELIAKVDELLSPLIIREDDIFNILYKGSKALIHDQGNYDSQDKVKVMTEEYVNATTHFQGWLYGTIQATMLDNVNVGMPSTVYIKKSTEHLRQDWIKYLKDNHLDAQTVPFNEYKNKYADKYVKYAIPQYNTDVSYSTGYFKTLLSGIISFFVVNDAIKKVYNQNLRGVKNSDGEYVITPEEVLIEANRELTEDEKKKCIEDIKEFSRPRYYAYMLLNMLTPYSKHSPNFRRFLMRCGWSPDELATMSFLGIASVIGIMIGLLAKLFYKGNLQQYGKSKPKGVEEARRATQKNLNLVNEGWLFNLMTDTINGPGSNYVEDKKEKFIDNPVSKYGQSKEVYINPDGTPTEEVVMADEFPEVYDQILEGIEYKSTEYDKEDPNYILAGFLYHTLQNVNRELVVKTNPVRTIQEFNKLFDMKSSTVKPVVDLWNILTMASGELIGEDVNGSTKIKKYLLDKWVFNKVGMETDKYGSVVPYYYDVNGDKIMGYFYTDADGEIYSAKEVGDNTEGLTKVYNYDHKGLHFMDFYARDARVENFQKNMNR